MSVSDPAKSLENENVCISMDEGQNGKSDSQDLMIPMVSIVDRKKKRRFLNHRPYASPTNRIIKKCGKYNVLKTNIPQKIARYAKDLGNTILSIRWRWILICTCIANIIAYLFFTVLWMLMVIYEESHMTEKNRKACITGTSSFTGYFILVVETMTTIGSGEITPTDCQSGWIMMTLQAITSVAIEGALVSAIYVKMSRPSNRDYATHFSKKAVICRRDGVQCLIFRIRDVYGKYWTKTNVKAVLIHRKDFMGGDSSPYYFQKLKLEDTGLLIWPQEVIHKVDQTSPFWNVSRIEMCRFRFEIMIILEGDSLTTGHPSQSQTSYTNKEVLWGYRFKPCVEYDELAQKYIVNKKMFNETVKYEIPECSARELQLALVECRTKKKEDG